MCPFYVRRYTGKTHARTGYELKWRLQKVIQRCPAPDNTRFFHCITICKTCRSACLSARNTAMFWSGTMISRCVTARAAHIYALTGSDTIVTARPCLARANKTKNRKQTRLYKLLHYLQEKNAPGTGSSPSAFRKIAQCMASSARMLAAALARSLLSNKGIAPA